MANNIQRKAIQDAYTDKALGLVVKSWENDDLDIAEMNNQLEALANLADGASNFNTFLEEANLVNLNLNH